MRGATIIGRGERLSSSGAKTLHQGTEGDRKEDQKAERVARIADSQGKAVSDLRDRLMLSVVLFGLLLSAALTGFLAYLAFRFIGSFFLIHAGTVMPAND
jgi:hypothetical protein